MYVESIAHFDEAHHPSIGGTMFAGQRVLPIAPAAQPFVRIVNNTIYGNDGNASLFPDAVVEPNDTLYNAVNTMQGRAHTPVTFTANATLGNSLNFRDDPSKDVDFYQFQMDIHDRVTITINSNNQLNTVLRLFNSVGEELGRSLNVAGDPTLNFTATAGGPYFVAVSGIDNATYSPISLSGRQTSQESGTYTINVNVQAPRTFLVDLRTLLGGSAFNITDLNGTVQIAAGGGGGNTGAAARNLVAAINGNGNLSGVTASTIGTNNVTHLPRGGRRPGNLVGDYERYVVIRGAANVVGIGGAAAELLPAVGTNEDQLLRETGILITEAATPTLVNNVLSNLRNGVVETASARDVNDRFHHRGTSNNPLTAVQTGQLFQHNAFGNMGVSIFNSGVILDRIERYDALIDTSDFNIPIGPNDPLFVNAANENFFPAPFARSIDSSVETLQERNQFVLVKSAAGITLSPIQAPDVDGAGQFRVDDPEVDTPQGLGGNVFKDRGSLDRADFVSPTITLVNPQDNDSQGRDLDKAISVVQVASGVFSNFSLQVVDGFDAADPFAGIGVDDSTLTGRNVQVTEGGLVLDLKGPAVTLFQDGVLLREGIDYVFDYNTTSNTIVLSPLAGIWADDKVYVIKVNNRDRFVIDAADGREAADTDSFTITNDVGDIATFEFDKGYSLRIAPTLGLQVPFAGAGAGGIIDGQRFTINDGTHPLGMPVVFEFDLNGNWQPANRRIPIVSGATADQIAAAIVNALSVAHLEAVNALGQPLAVQPTRLAIPLQPRDLGSGLVHVGATEDHRVDVTLSTLTSTVSLASLRFPTTGGQGLVDNERFVITRGGQNFIFEFDSDASGSTIPGSIVIPFLSIDSAAALGQRLSAVLINPRGAGNELGLDPLHVGSGIIQFGELTDQTFNLQGSNLRFAQGQIPVGLTVPPAGGSAIQDNETFTVSNGNQTFTFELSNDGLTPSTLGNEVIPFQVTDSAEAIAVAIAGFLNNTRDPLMNSLALGAFHIGGGVIRLQGQPNHTLDVSDTVLTRQVSIGGVRDGEVITLRENNTVSTIELDNDGAFGTGARNTVVTFDASDTHLDLAAKLTAAIANAGVGLTPIDVGNGEINVGGEAGVHTLTTSQPSSLSLSGQPGVNSSTTLVMPSLPGIQVRSEGEVAFADGDFFTISNGFATAVFEFDKDGVFVDLDGDMLPDNFLISLVPGDTQAAIALKIQTQIASANAALSLGVTPVLLGNGVVALGAPVETVLFTAGLTTQNLLAGLVDGETFTVNDGTRTVTFEFEDIDLGNGVVGTNVPITFRAGSFVETVSDAIRAALASANLGLNPFLPNPGDGRVELRDTTRHLTDVANTSLTLEGVAGGAAAVRIRTSFTEAQVAAAIVDGINSATDKITGVSAKIRGGSTLFVDISNASGQPANFVSGFATVDGIPNFFLSAVKDLAGNSLAGNQPTDEAVFTILLPGVKLDFGDAPDPFAGAGRYPTLFENDGARHVITSGGLFLGSGVDAERDGQPTLAADGDDSDHAIDLVDSNISLLGLPPFALQVPANGGLGITDGDRFTIQRAGRPAVTFEFDNNLATTFPDIITFAVTDTADDLTNKIVAAINTRIDALALRPANLGNGLVFLGGVPALNIGVANSSLTLTGEPLLQLVLPLRLEVPANGAAGIQNDDTFILSDGQGNSVVFEFDHPGGGLTTGTFLIILDGTETADEVAQKIVDAIQANSVTFPTLSATHGNGVVELKGLSSGHTLDVTDGPSLSVDRSLQTGERFIINDGVNPSVTFEISVNASPVTPGNVAVSITNVATDAEVVEAIRATVQGQLGRLSGLTPVVANDHAVTLAHHFNDSLDLSQSSLTHANRAPASLQVTGAGLALEIPAVAELHFPAGGGAVVADGDFFTIGDGMNPPVKFEFDLAGGVNDPNAVRIPFAATSTANDLANAVIVQLQNLIASGDLVGITPISLGGGRIDLQPSPRVRLDTTGANGHLTQLGPIADGDSFTIDDRTHTAVTFEFDNNTNFQIAGSRPVEFHIGDSANDLADRIVAAIQSAVLANELGTPTKVITPVNLGAGVVDLSGPADLLADAGTTSLNITGEPGGIADGQRFTLTDGNQTLVFEFDRNGKFVEGRLPITFTSTDDANQMGALMAAAINAAIPTLMASDMSAGRLQLQVDDENGVRFDGVFVPGRTTQITVTASGTGFLDAWFDFNRDGDWDDPGEQVFQNVVVHAGENILFVTVPPILPSNSPLGDTYARFRLSSVGSLQPTGLAVDGEVEDYKIRIISNEAPTVAFPGLEDQTVVNEDQADTLINLFDVNGLGQPAFNDVDRFNGNGDHLSFSVGTHVLTVVTTGATLREGETITIANTTGTGSRTFEFDRDGIVTSGHIAVTYTAASTAGQIAASLASGITAQTYGVTASVVGASVTLTGEGAIQFSPVFTGITVSSGRSLEILQSGANFRDGGTVTIAANTGALPEPSRTFEFDNDGIVAAGNIAVSFTATSTAADLSAALAREIRRENYGVGGVQGTLNSSVVRLGGNSSIQFGSVFDGVTRLSDTTLRVVQGGLGFTEAGTITITAAQGGEVTFEFTSDGVFNPNNVPVVIDTTRTPEQIAGILAQRINLALFGVLATVDPLDARLVRLSGDAAVSLSPGFADVTVQTGNALEILEDGAELHDSATITIPSANGLQSRTFELDSNGSVAAGRIAIPFDATTTAVEVAGRLAAQIATANYGVVATIDPLNGAILRLSGAGLATFSFNFSDIRLVSEQPILLASIGIDGQTLRLDYQQDENGPVNVTVRATDQGGLFVEHTILVNVNRVNDQPVATGVESASLLIPTAGFDVVFTAHEVSTFEDFATVIMLGGDDGDPLPLENQALEFSIVDASNANGVITNLNTATGQFIYTPLPNFNGIGTIVYSVRDDGSAGPIGQLESERFTVTINVAAINDPPVGHDQTVTTAEDATIVITLTGDDDGNPSTTEGQTLTFTIVQFPAHGTLLSGVDLDGSLTGTIGQVTGPITYLPNLNFNNNANSPLGPDTFTFNVSDNGLPPETSLVPATVTINVTPVNDPPVPEVESATTTMSATCMPTALGDQVVTCENHVTTLTLGGSTGDPENNQTLTYTQISGSAHGMLSGITSISSTQSTVVFTPTAGFNGMTSFVVRATDNGQTNGVADPRFTDLTVTVTVQPVNEAPIAFNQSVATNEDTAANINLTADDGDPDVAQVLRYFIVQLPPNGTLSGINTTTGEVIGQLRYAPAPNYNGGDSFTFRVQDDDSAGNPPNRFSNVATVTLEVIPVNDVPIAFNQSVTTNEDVALTITLTGDDGDPLPTPADIQNLTFEIASGPTRGALGTLNAATGQVVYTPGSNFNGTDTFTFRVRDDGTNPANLVSLSATVTITVNALNDAPEFTVGPVQTVNEDAGPQTIIGWASGIRPGPISAVDEVGQIVTFTTTNDNPGLFLSTGQPTVSSSGILTYTPAPNANGQAVLTIVARDNGSGVFPHVNTSAPQTVTINITPVNDPPQFIKGPNVSTNEDAPLQVVNGWATNIAPGPVSAVDEANQGLQFLISFTTTGNLAFAVPPTINPANGTLTYQPLADTNGTATVSVTLQDGGDSAPPNINVSPVATFLINVNPINDAPEFTPGDDVFVNEDAGLVRITDWATDIRPGPAAATDENSQALTFVANTVSFSGGLTFITAPFVEPLTGDLVFQTSPNKWGTATVTVRLRDSGPGAPPHVNESALHTLTISVASVNDPPEFTLGANQLLAEDALGQTVFGFVSGIRPGPVSASDEADQSVSFVTTNDNNSLFALQPAIAANGTLTYSPAPNRNGVAVVTVDAQDSGPSTPPHTNSAKKTFTITITAVNDPPTLTVPGAQTIDEDVSLAIGGISAADIDVAEGTGQVQVVFRATSGTVNLNTNVPGGVLASQVTDNGSSTVSVLAPLAQINTTLAHMNSQSQPDGLTYRGNANFNGQDQVVITVNDLGNTGSPGPQTVTRTVPITVTPVNDPPILANPIADITVLEDAPVTLVELFPQVFNDPDVLTNNDRLTLRVVNNSNPLVAATLINGTVLVITPVANASGETLITVEAADLSGEFVRDTFRFTVLPVNDPPTAVNDNFTVPGSSPSVLPILANDFDIDSVINPATLAIVSAPSGGGVIVNANGTVTFTPNAGFKGQTSFTYTVSDFEGATSQPATVTVTVNAPPTANADAATTNQGTPVAIAVLANDTDPDGSIVTSSVTITQQPANGSVVVNSTTGVVTYSPSLAFSGTDTFRYTIRDDIGGVSAPGTVTVTVVPFRPWQNPAAQVANGAPGALDVNGDGFVSAIDVLLITNRINRQGTGPLPTPTVGNSPPPFYDVNGDGQITPIDALLVINFLNGPGSNQAEGESIAIQSDVLGIATEASAAAVLVSEFTPGYRQSRYSATSEMPPALYDELVAPRLVNRVASDSLVEISTYGYRDEIHSSPEEAFRVSLELDDLLTDLASNRASDDELRGHDYLADAALTDLLEQDFFGS